MENKRFEPIDEEKRKFYTDILGKRIKEKWTREEKTNGYTEYEVILQDQKFVTSMTDEELTRSAELTIALMEELKKMNNLGYTRDFIERIEKTVRMEEKDELIAQIRIWAEFFTEELNKLISDLDEVRRVGGAYALFTANPMIKSAIYGVYTYLADTFDDEKKYGECSYFLMRAVMKMHSTDVK